MKIFFLTIKTLWRNRWSYLILLFELVLVAVLFLSLCSKLQGTISSQKIVNVFNDKNMYYYSEYMYIEKSLGDILKKETKEKLKITDIPYLIFSDENQNLLCAYGYCDSIIEAAKIELSDGIWFDKYRGKNIPILSADLKYKVGEIINVQRGNETCQLEVIGFLEKNSYILNFHSGASSGIAELDDFVTHPDVQFIVPFQSKRYLSMGKKYIESIEENKQKMVFVSDEDAAKQFIEETRGYGGITSVRTMEKNYIKSLRDDYMVNGIVLIVFLILCIVGLIGFNGIQNAIGEKNYIIYYFLGCTHGQCVVIETLKNVIIFIISFSVLMAIRMKSDIFMYSTRDFAIINYQTIILTFLFLFLICFGTSVCYIRRLGKKNLIAVYKSKA